jgi:hypothetical protein
MAVRRVGRGSANIPDGRTSEVSKVSAAAFRRDDGERTSTGGESMTDGDAASRVGVEVKLGATACDRLAAAERPMHGLVHADAGNIADVGLVRADAGLDEGADLEPMTRDFATEEGEHVPAVGRDVERGCWLLLELRHDEEDAGAAFPSIGRPKRMVCGLLPDRSRRALRCAMISFARFCCAAVMEWTPLDLLEALDVFIF